MGQMIAAGESDSLRIGLRALATLGRAAPLDLAGFAGLTGMSKSTGKHVLALFESHGYARRVPGGSIFVLTRMGLDLLGETSAAGRLVSQSIEPITLCSRQLGRPITLGLPSGDEFLCGVVAGETTGLPRPGEPMPTVAAIARLAVREPRHDHALGMLGGRGQLAVPVPLTDDLAAILSVHGMVEDDPATLTSFLTVLKLLAKRLRGQLCQGNHVQLKQRQYRFYQGVEHQGMGRTSLDRGGRARLGADRASPSLRIH